MEFALINKIKSDKKMYKYLLEHSFWYRILNRDENEYMNFYKEYKKYTRENNFSKVNNTIDDVELLANMLNMLK